MATAQGPVVGRSSAGLRRPTPACVSGQPTPRPIARRTPPPCRVTHAGDHLVDCCPQYAFMEYQELAKSFDVVSSSVLPGEGHNGRGLFTSQDVGGDEVMLSVPTDATLPVIANPAVLQRKDTHTTQARLGELYEGFAERYGVSLPTKDVWPFIHGIGYSSDSVAPVTTRLAVALLWMKSESEEWRLWTESAQSSSLSTASLWTANEMALLELQDYSLIGVVARQRGNILREYQRIKQEGLDRVLGVTERDWVWASSLVHSRSLHLDVDNVAMRALLPVADWTNHSFEPNTRLATNLSDGSFELRSMGGGIPQGGELSLAYGLLMPNISLAMNFGFVVEGNPNDGLPPELLAGVSGRVSPSSLLRALGEQGLLEGASSGELGRIAAVCRGVSGQFMPRMADIQSQPGLMSQIMATAPPVTAGENEAMDALAANVASRLEESITSLAMDLETLEQHMSPALRLAISFRTERKRLLHAALEVCTAWRKSYSVARVV